MTTEADVFITKDTEKLVQNLSLVAVELKEQLNSRGETLSYGNVLVASYLLKAYEKNGQEFSLAEYTENKAKQIDFDKLEESDLESIKNASEQVALQTGLETVKLSNQLTVPVEEIKLKRSTADIESEILSATAKDAPKTTYLPLFRYTDSVGLDFENQVGEPEMIAGYLSSSDHQVLGCARGLRSPLESLDDARSSEFFNAFTIDQMLKYPQFVLERTHQEMYKGKILNESRFSDLLYKQLILSQREMLANTLQGSKRNTPYISASLDQGGFRKWGRYRIEMIVPVDKTLNVRDLSIQYDDVLKLKPMTPVEQERIRGNLHDQIGADYNPTGGQQLDEIAILGGVRKDWIVSIVDLDNDSSVVWNRHASSAES